MTSGHEIAVSRRTIGERGISTAGGCLSGLDFQGWLHWVSGSGGPLSFVCFAGLSVGEPHGNRQETQGFGRGGWNDGGGSGAG